jgi:hypothetical protein
MTTTTITRSTPTPFFTAATNWAGRVPYALSAALLAVSLVAVVGA